MQVEIFNRHIRHEWIDFDVFVGQTFFGQRYAAIRT
jgi:hypothetical protein